MSYVMGAPPPPIVRDTPGVVAFARRVQTRARVGIEWLFCKADVQWLELLATGIALGWALCMARSRMPGLAAGLLHTMGIERGVIGSVAVLVALPSILACLLWATGDDDDPTRKHAIYLARRVGLFALSWFYQSLALCFAINVGTLNTGSIAYGGIGLAAMGAFYRLRIRRARG